ncbi:hypothetical protein G6F55_001896 [Rhizopus delemar]|nr:hypothetical protein G6F55_001896 [Rhizopus delemar]
MSLPKQVETQIEDFIDRLKRRQIVGSFFVAKETAIILRQVVSMSRWRDANVLIGIVTTVGIRLASAQPNELAVGNIVKRVLKVIREVSRGDLSTDGRDDRATATPDDSSFDEEDIEDDDEEEEKEEEEEEEEEKEEEKRKRPALSTQTSMFRLLTDIEVIMTTGQSRTVQEFLIRAAQKRKFQVIVAETAPTYQGHKMALALSKAGIDTTVIADSAVFAAMPRVNKVVLGAHAVLANGALVSVSGSHLLAAAAKHHSTPVLVCTALYKLSPLFAYDADAFNVTVPPQNVLSFQEGAIIDKVTITNPYYDYVAPEYVSLFIHNLGSAPPTYVYRLINDNYDPEDSALV